MPMIGPMPPAPEPPAAPTPWSFNKWSHAVRDARGNLLFEVNGEALDPDEDAALARELVDLVNRAASTTPYADIVHAYAAGVTSALFADAPDVHLPVTVETHDREVEFEVHRQSPPGFAEIRVTTDFGGILCVFDPSSARKLAYALLAAVGAAPVEGPAEPNPRDPSTWRRYVDEVGDTWFEFAPGRVGCGSRDDLFRLVSDRLPSGRAPETFGDALDDAREWFGLRPAEPDPRDPSTWRRYVDSDEDEWFEFAPGRVGCGSRDVVVWLVSDRMSRGLHPEDFGGALDDVRDRYGLRRA